MPIRVILLLYTLAQIAVLPLLVVYVALRVRRDRRYGRRFAERLGTLPPLWRQTAPGGIWLHAVSVGEVLAAGGLLQRLKQQYPHRPLYLSCTTVAGRALAEVRLAGLADAIFYAPLDLPWTVRRTLRTLRPAVLVVLETEIWPRLWWEVVRSGRGLVVVNGRISDKAWPRYRRWRVLFAPVLRLPRRLLAQSAVDAQRFVALGAEHAADAGNLKYDIAPSAQPLAVDLREWFAVRGQSRVLIAASTLAAVLPGEQDEERQVLSAYREVLQHHPETLLVLAPRKPERFNAVADLLTASGVPFVRRSSLHPVPEARVLLVDTIGELAALMPLAEAVFVGGSLVAWGGHNLLEPALCGKPVLSGPHVMNFAQIAADLDQAGGLITVHTAAELAQWWVRILADPAHAAALGERARNAALARQGATDRAIAAIAEAVGAAVPGPVRSSLTVVALTPLSWLWRFVSGWQQSGAYARRQMLPAPVISVGGLAMGGVGKTPLVAWLAGQARAQGLQVAVLTRGYRRQDTQIAIALQDEPGDPHRLGEEASLLHAAGAHLGVFADRYTAGQALLQRTPVDLFLLDDGFQHRQLHRDVDIVLIDALNPWTGGALPLGRLRESAGALQRAQVVVLTRAPEPLPALQRQIQQAAPGAAIVRSWTVPQGWVDAATGQSAELPPGLAIAFCGLGNPGAFWQTLYQLGVHTLERRSFPDHHHYSAGDLASLAAAGATHLLTTGKDALNLPPGPWPLPVYALRIAVQFDRPELLLRFVTEPFAEQRSARQV